MRTNLILKLLTISLSLVIIQSVSFAQNSRSSASEVLTNEKVVAMVRAGLAANIIVNKIRTSKTSFNTETDELIRLQQAKVPPEVINAMLESSTGEHNLPKSVESTVNETGLPKEIGVYVKVGGEWKEVLPEVVNWKTGGVLKGVASMGLIKGDVNGHLQGGASRTRVAIPGEFLIVSPEGVAITEYQLLKLNMHKDSREFRTITGGVLHAKGGATKDLVSYEGQKIANRTYVVKLTNLSSGEYGFLPPGAVMSGSAGSQLGKMYTFGVGQL